MFKGLSRLPQADYWRYLLFLSIMIFISATCLSCSDSGSGSKGSGILQIADLQSSRVADFQINGAGHVAWLLSNEGQSEIYIYREGSVASIAASQEGFGGILLNDLDQIVWVGLEQGETKLYLFNEDKTAQISNGFTNPLVPQINNQGQIVFVAREDNVYQLLLYDDGRITNLTDNDRSCSTPQISDSGDVAWFGADVSKEAFDLYLYENGVTNKINEKVIFALDENYSYRHINKMGQVVWASNERAGLYDNIVHLYDGSGIVQLKPMVHNINPVINNSGQVVWQGWDGNDYEIFLYSDDQVIQVTDNEEDDAFPVINDEGVLAWQGSDGNDLEIFVYDDGVIGQLTNNDLDDLYPKINNKGQVAWLSKNADGEYQALFRAAPGAGEIVNANAGMVIESASTPWIARAAVSDSGESRKDEEFPKASVSVEDESSCRTDYDFLFSFAVLGDSRLSCGWWPDQHKYPHDFVKNLGGHLAEWLWKEPGHPDKALSFVVFSGDMATYPVDTTYPKVPHLDDWFGAFGGQLSYYGIPLYPVMGNHETYEPPPHTIGKYYPEAAKYSLQTFENQMTKPKHYSVNYNYMYIDGYGNYFWDWPKDSPNSRFFVISWYDEYYSDNNGLITDSCIQALKTHLEAARSKNIKNIFVMGHVPLPDKPSSSSSPANTNTLIDLLYEYDVKVYFAGHKHLYYHRNINRYDPTTKKQVSFGHELVCGAAGADIGSGSHKATMNEPCDPTNKFISLAVRYNFAIVQVYDDSITVRVYTTIDDCFQANGLKAIPPTMEFERFCIMQNSDTVYEFCNGPKGGQSAQTTRTDILYCKDPTNPLPGNPCANSEESMH